MKSEKMCDYHVLYQNEHGYVVRCKKCDCIKVAFGTTAISLTRQQLEDFAEVVNEYKEAVGIGLYPNHKAIAIPTTAKSIQLLYSAEDLQHLIEILNEALLSLAIEPLLTINHK
jgi:hypothetical protein